MELSNKDQDQLNKQAHLWFTSDNEVYFEKQHAIDHSMHLEDKTISSMTRAEVEKELQQLYDGSPDEELDDELLLA